MQDSGSTLNGRIPQASQNKCLHGGDWHTPAVSRAKGPYYGADCELSPALPSVPDRVSNFIFKLYNSHRISSILQRIVLYVLY